MELLFMFTTITIVIINAQSNQDYYTGAVVQYSPIYNDADSPGANIQTNINEYEKYIKQAKEAKADIIVFPECGLTTTKFELELHLYTTIFPDPHKKIVACKTGNWTQVIERLSCAAKDNSIYVVVNLPERMMLDSSDKNYEIFNSNIVFDRTGALIARFRKYNVFGDTPFNVTETPDLTFFETDFNVTFGTFIHNDILFTKPSLELLKKYEKVTDIVFPSAWVSELPFLTAVQTQVGWARANGVNFLGASYSDPKNSRGGSVIYQAIGDVTYNIPVQNESIPIILKIKKIKQRVNPKSFNSTAKATNTAIVSNSNLKLETHNENMSNYTTQLLNKTEEDFKLCHESLCCNFTVKLASQTKVDYFYRMVVYYGPRSFELTKTNVQICGIAACKNESLESCGHRVLTSSNAQRFDEISIKGEFIDEGSSVIFPTNVLYDLGVLPSSAFNFTSILVDCYRQVEMKTTQQVKEILGFGIYSVLKDSPSIAKGLSGAVIAIIVIAVIIVVALIGLLIWRRYKNGTFKHSIVN